MVRVGVCLYIVLGRMVGLRENRIWNVILKLGNKVKGLECVDFYIYLFI